VLHIIEQRRIPAGAQMLVLLEIGEKKKKPSNDSLFSLSLSLVDVLLKVFSSLDFLPNIITEADTASILVRSIVSKYVDRQSYLRHSRRS
jgi:hypothetical protein